MRYKLKKDDANTEKTHGKKNVFLRQSGIIDASNKNNITAEPVAV